MGRSTLAGRGTAVAALLLLAVFVSNSTTIADDDAVLFYVVTAVNSSGESPAGEARVIASHCP